MSIRNIITHTLLAFIIGIAQISAIQSLSFRAIFFMPLIIVIALVFRGDIDRALMYGITTGVVLDVFSPMPFGLHVVLFSLLALLLHLVLVKFFSRRSILSISGLALSATLLFCLLFVSFEDIYYYIKDINITFFSSSSLTWIFWSTIANGLSAIVLHSIISYKRKYSIRPYIVKDSHT